ncbi:SDR family oxidoreductase [Photobacterium jeanii]|uniref:SDR family oxidoreductase n=1 Tax=Photobacterium jeanii TaxID=858640 RepID=A0A178K7R0_9GAMM|nr:SDR family NAD(P)-dependent oxidoreductase [Photobacterium jeanii]OAN13378.1 SDR family oxidoreductase [Photobacterium jeanii]PST91194.1 short chain dehydrogenase [Photobacterium jeanii]
MKILIIGGSGGIGAALLEQFIVSDIKATLYATYRSTQPQIQHDNLVWFKADIASDSDVKKLSESITNLDILINAAGGLSLASKTPEKSVKEFDTEFFQHNLNANTIPTLLLGKYFSSHLKAKHTTYFVSLSARIGSIEDNKIGGWISYRCSKAALNMAIKTISIEWKFRQPNCCVIAFHPGTTDTALSKPFQKNVPPHKLFTATYVAQCLLELLDKLTSNDTGKFYSFDGKAIPW